MAAVLDLEVLLYASIIFNFVRTIIFPQQQSDGDRMTGTIFLSYALHFRELSLLVSNVI